MFSLVGIVNNSHSCNDYEVSHNSWMNSLLNGEHDINMIGEEYNEEGGKELQE